MNLEQIREDHGLAQAKAETKLRESIGNRYATRSLTLGHRHGFWDGVRYVLTLQSDFESLTAGEIIRELRKREGSIYWPLLEADPRTWVICDRCDTRVLIDAEGICDVCNNDFNL